jgi:O-antigen/teichoic acid export membrane protein
MNGLGLRGIAINVASTLARQLSSGVLSLITLSIIAREFGPEGNGAYTLALLLPTMLATILNMGIGPANVYFLGAGKVHPRQAWRVTFKYCVAIGLIGWMIGSLAITLYSDRWFPGVPTTMLWLSLAFFPITFIYTAIGNIFQGLQDFKRFNAVLIIQPIVNLILVGFFVFVGVANITLILICYIISSTFTLALAYRLLLQVLNERQGPIVSKYARDLIIYGYKAHLSNILAFVNDRANIILLGYFLGPSAVGLYAVAIAISEKLWLFSGALSTVILPRLSQLSTDEDKRKLLTPLIARWSLWITFTAALVIIVFGQYAIIYIFGDRYEQSYRVILWLMPGVILGACSMVLANDIAARGRPELNMATSWISVVVNIIGNVLLIPRYGIEGAALATSFAYSLNLVLRLFMHNYFTGVKFYKNLIIGKDDIVMLRSVLVKK